MAGKTVAATRREHLERVLEVLWLAYDGNRRLQGRQETTFAEAAAPLAREIRATVRELAGLGAVEGKSKRDELADRRQQRAKDRVAATDKASAAGRRRKPASGG